VRSHNNEKLSLPTIPFTIISLMIPNEFKNHRPDMERTEGIVLENSKISEHVLRKHTLTSIPSSSSQLNLRKDWFRGFLRKVRGEKEVLHFICGKGRQER